MARDHGKSFEDELVGLGIDPAAAQSELQLLADIGRALRRSWRAILFAAVSGGVLAYGGSYLREVRYTSFAQVMIETRVAPEGDFTPVVSNIPTSITSLESELEVLRSVDLVERVVDRFSLMADPEFFDPERDLVDDQDGTLTSIDRQRELAIANVAERLTIEQVGNVSAVYAVSFTSAEPEKAARLANALAEEYVAATRAAKLRSLELAQGWLAARTRELQQDLSDLTVKLEQHLLSAPYSADEIETIKARSVAAERRLTQIRRERSQIALAISRVGMLNGQGQLLSAAEAIPSPSASLLQAVQLVQGGQSEEEAGLASAITADLERLGSRRASLEEEARTVEAELASTRTVLGQQARRDAESSRITNDIAVVEAIYRDFMTQLSRRTEQSEYLDADARIISMGRPPLDPSEPRRGLLAAGGFGGLALLLMLVLVLREVNQSRMRNIREFEAGTGLPLIGVVPEVKAENAPFATFLGDKGGIAPELMRFARKLRWSILAELPGDKSGRLAGSGMAEEPSSRRKSRSKVQSRSGGESASSGSASYGAASPDQAHTVIAGASANRSDGQSSSMLALACSFADGGEKVLLIDCDFSHSPLAVMLNESDINLEYIRSDPRKAKQYIVETAYEGLHVLPAPKAADDATQRIGAAEWRRLFRHLSTQYDRILLDTPPLMSGIDTAVLHQVADAVLLFARWNSTTSGESRSMLKVLGDVGVTPLAVVATRIHLDRVRKFGDDALFFLGKSLVR
jgi:uncharacterized protein involved in exopolysaccharide biosynthesis/Mrp family chromosome partitioning ATPase